ncbi:SulP family inorganic anion transporter [Aetokthonos hydrillicola]|uniref:SulP family inorganic anion transporter n=1 Tax=Aetokthonos hydrillicola TaxID=1550245 RepID=UPI001FBACEEF
MGSIIMITGLNLYIFNQYLEYLIAINIQKHPDLILNSVKDYQLKLERAKNQAIENISNDLMKNPVDFIGDSPTLGSIPQSLPLPQSIPHWNDFGLIQELINPALALAALGSIESLLSAVVADGMTVSEKHNSDRELIGQGLANIVVPFFGGIPATGAIARTAVNVRAGGRTRLSGVIQGVALAAIVLTLAPLAAQIPLAALAGILIVTSVRMIEWEAIGLLVRATYSDFAVMILTWMVTIFFDLVLAVEVGLIAAGALFIKRMSELSLAKVPETDAFPPGIPLELTKEIAVYRVDGPVFFGAAERFVTFLRDEPEVKYLILRMRFVPNMDTTGLVAMEDIYHDLKRHGCRLILSGLQSDVQKLLERTGLLDKIGRENCFETTDAAIYALNPNLEAYQPGVTSNLGSEELVA